MPQNLKIAISDCFLFLRPDEVDSGLQGGLFYTLSNYTEDEFDQKQFFKDHPEGVYFYKALFKKGVNSEGEPIYADFLTQNGVFLPKRTKTTDLKFCYVLAEDRESEAGYRVLPAEGYHLELIGERQKSQIGLYDSKGDFNKIYCKRDCKAGEYYEFDSISCRTCGRGCLACESATNCSKCDSGPEKKFTLLDGKCVQGLGKQAETIRMVGVGIIGSMAAVFLLILVFYFIFEKSWKKGEEDKEKAKEHAEGDGLGYDTARTRMIGGEAENEGSGSAGEEGSDGSSGSSSSGNSSSPEDNSGSGSTEKKNEGGEVAGDEKNLGGEQDEEIPPTVRILALVRLIHQFTFFLSNLSVSKLFEAHCCYLGPSGN